MVCNTCGAKLKEGEKICTKCGAPIVNQANVTVKTKRFQNSSVFLFKTLHFIAFFVFCLFVPGLIGIIGQFNDPAGQKVLPFIAVGFVVLLCVCLVALFFLIATIKLIVDCRNKIAEATNKEENLKRVNSEYKIVLYISIFTLVMFITLFIMKTMSKQLLIFLSYVLVFSIVDMFSLFNLKQKLKKNNIE